MLHLLTGVELVAAGGHDGLLPDSLAAAESGQRRIRQIRSGGNQIFMDPDEIPLAFREQVQDHLPVGFGFLGAMHLRHCG